MGRIPLSVWVWGGYAAALFWVGLVFWHARGAMAVERRNAFRAEGGRVAALWADRLADRWGEEAERALLIRGFSGQADSRATGLLDEKGTPGPSFGGAALPPPVRSTNGVEQDLQTDPPAWGFWAPVWVDGRRAGTLYWPRDAGSLLAAQRRGDRAFWAAWACFSLTGALAASALSRRLAIPDRKNPG